MITLGVAFCNNKCSSSCLQASRCTLPKKKKAFIEKIKTVSISPSATPTRKRGKHG